MANDERTDDGDVDMGDDLEITQDHPPQFPAAAPG